MIFGYALVEFALVTVPSEEKLNGIPSLLFGVVIITCLTAVVPEPSGDEKFADGKRFTHGCDAVLVTIRGSDAAELVLLATTADAEPNFIANLTVGMPLPAVPTTAEF